MPWKPTNANDVTLIISLVERENGGFTTGSSNVSDTSAIVVDSFSIDDEQDMSALSGVGRFRAFGISKGDVETGFSFTVQGEDATLFAGLAADDGDANELQIIVEMQDYRATLEGAYAGTRSLSGDSGDPTELQVEGIAKNYRDNQ